jgi:hypothetical protein
MAFKWTKALRAKLSRSRATCLRSSSHLPLLPYLIDKGPNWGRLCSSPTATPTGVGG